MKNFCDSSILKKIRYKSSITFLRKSIASYRDDESKVFTFNETYYYALPLEEEMNDHFYKHLETLFNECFHQNLSIKPDYSVIIQQNNEHVKKFVACEIYQHDPPLPKYEC